MSFPKLEVPKYTVTLPISKKKVTYRPFLVKEQKLLMLLDTGNVEEVNDAVNDLVKVCTFNEVDPKKIGSVDLEYLFLDIRKRSVGESYDIIVTCENCEATIKATADLNNLEVVNSEEHKGDKILLTDTVGIQMLYPPFSAVLDVYANLSEDTLLTLIMNSVKGVYTPENYTEVDDSNREELKDFLESLTAEQFSRITNFFESMPYIVQKLDVPCTTCEFVNHVEIRGLDNFFG